MSQRSLRASLEISGAKHTRLHRIVAPGLEELALSQSRTGEGSWLGTDDYQRTGQRVDSARRMIRSIAKERCSIIVIQKEQTDLRLTVQNHLAGLDSKSTEKKRQRFDARTPGDTTPLFQMQRTLCDNPCPAQTLLETVLPESDHSDYNEGLHRLFSKATSSWKSWAYCSDWTWVGRGNGLRPYPPYPK